jgi:hypothetical protein
MYKLPRNSKCIGSVIFLNVFPFVDNQISDVTTALESIPEIIGQFLE